jgi:hypothetical protein
LPALLIAELFVPIPNAPDTAPLGETNTLAAVAEIEPKGLVDPAVANAEPEPGPADMDCEPPVICPLTVKPTGLLNTETLAPLPTTEKPFEPAAAGSAHAIAGNK